MGTILLRIHLLVLFFAYTALWRLCPGGLVQEMQKKDISYCLSNNYIPDTVVVTRKETVKICSCQILDLQSTNHRQRNIVLLAERSNGKSLRDDLNRISRVMGREKRHMQSFFYDKLVVLNSFTERTDCRSLYLKLKRKNKYLVLYDILDADTMH